MISKKIINNLTMSSLMSDSYCLGSHWVYDENQLKNIPVDWNALNSPNAMWHKGKTIGDFTHYGDQIFFLYEYAKNNVHFDGNKYAKYWKEKMTKYEGYIDAATRETIKNMDDGQKIPCGSLSTDLSIVGRIAPLLFLSKDKNEFLANVELFTKITHNSEIAIESSKFFATLLLDVLNGNDIIESMNNIKNNFSQTIQKYINDGLNSKNDDSFKTIRDFGPACDIDGGFSGVIHVLSKYNNIEDAMINNAKAGGDNSARAIIISLIFTAKYGTKNIPKNWLKFNQTL